MLTRPSSLTKFLRCEYLWHTIQVLGVVTPETAGARSRGSFFHALLEVALKHYAEHGWVFAYDGADGENMVRAVAAEQYRERGVAVDEIEARQCLAAIRYHIPLLDLPSWEVVRLPDGRPCVEIELVAEGWPSEEHSIAHRLDLVMRKRSTGLVWHIDFKSTRENIVKPNSIDRDYQLLFARRLLRQHGVNVDGSLLLYLRSQAPTPPAVVYAGKKNEGLSTSADQPCTWEIYKAAIEARGEDPSELRYAGNPEAKSEGARLSMREKLAHNVFAKWVPDTTSPAGERAMEHQLVRSLDRMQQLALGLASPTRNLGYACRPSPRSHGCEYNTWCSAGLDKPDGYDTTQLGLMYRALPTSPLYQIKLSPPANPNASFVEWARKHGSPDHGATQEFKP